MNTESIYSSFIKNNNIDPTDKNSITLEDILKCTSKNRHWSVRFLSRIVRLNKGWINDDKVLKLIGPLAKDESKLQYLNKITEVMSQIAEDFKAESQKIYQKANLRKECKAENILLRRNQENVSDLEQLAHKISEISKPEYNKVTGLQGVEAWLTAPKYEDSIKAVKKTIKDLQTRMNGVLEARERLLSFDVFRVISSRDEKKLNQGMLNLEKMKLQFYDFAKGKQINTDEDLKKCYRDFVEDMAMKYIHGEDERIGDYIYLTRDMLPPRKKGAFESFKWGLQSKN